MFLFPFFFFPFITEEIERREKALLEELELIETQIGLGKQQQNFDGNTSLNAPEEVSQTAEEGEENRDPNPENNVETTKIEDLNVSIKMEKDEDVVENAVEINDEEQVDQIKKDENNG